MKNGKIILLLTVLGFIWGSGYTLSKFAMTNGVPALGYAFWQSIGPAIILSLICLFTQKNTIKMRQHWPYFLICGLIGIAIPNTNMYYIASHMPAGLLAVIVNTVPLIVYPLAIAFKQERFDLWRLLALMIGVSGIIIIIGVSSQGMASVWSIIALISPIAFAFCSIYIAARQPVNLSAIEAASGMLMASSMMLFPLVMSQNAFYPLSAPFDLVKWIVILEIILSSLGYILFFNLIRLAGPVFYSLTGGIVALTGLFWGYCIYDEIPTPEQGLAAGLVILAIFLLSWKQSQQVRGI